MNSDKCALTLGKRFGREIFVLGNVSTEALGPYDILPSPDTSRSSPEEWEVTIEVYRNGGLFDVGMVKYLGGHDGSHHIYGLKEVWPDGEMYRGEGSFFGTGLLASKFTLGDIIVLDVPLKDVRGNLFQKMI